MKWLALSSCLVITLILVGCGGVNSVYFDNKQCITGTVSSSSGSQIYNAGCSALGCHSPKGSINIAGKTAQDITNAIRSVGAMQSLSCLTPEEIQKIGNYLARLKATNEFVAEN